MAIPVAQTHRVDSFSIHAHRHPDRTSTDVNRWLVRRVADAVATALLAIVVLVVLVHALPGDPLAGILGDRPASPEVIAALRERWGADRSMATVLQDFFSGLARGDLSYSLIQQRPVVDVLAERIGPTLMLGGLALLINFTVGLALGLWAALHPDTWRARALSAFTVVGYAIPSFTVGMLLVWLFAVKLAWLPAGGMVDPLSPASSGWWPHILDIIRHLALPVATMVVATIAVPLRHQRAAAMETMAAPWVRAARARGVSPAAIAWRHCWRPALTPIVTLFGLWLPMLVSGAVFVEAVYAWPGLGSLVADAAAARDVPLVIGAGLLLVVTVQLGSLLADALYRVVDPAQRTVA